MISKKKYLSEQSLSVDWRLSVPSRNARYVVYIWVRSALASRISAPGVGQC